MTIWVTALKGLGYLWFTSMIVLAQFVIVRDVYERFIAGAPALQLDIAYIRWIALFAAPGAALLFAAERLRSKSHVKHES